MPDGMFTITQFWSILLGLCGGIITISGAVAVVVAAVNKFKAPEKALAARIEACENRIVSLEADVASIKAGTNDIEASQRITQEALWALLGHAIDGNNVADLKKAQSKLHDHIFNS